MSLTAALLRDLMKYDETTGLFTSRVKLNSRWPAGRTRGGINHDGYRLISIKGRQYMAHRLVWLYVHGCWPDQEVDHINGDKDDNRLANLRLANREQNNRNARIRKDNKSGLKGVHRIPSGRYVAAVSFKNKKQYLGVFPTAQEAHQAYEREAVKLHGAFARTK